MRSVKIAELKDHLSEHLRAVADGAEIEVTDRNRLVARIIPIRKREPGVDILPASVPFASVRDERHAPATWGARVLELLHEERQADR